MHHAGQLREERRALVASLEYAFAMGHGCSIGGHPDRREIGQRAAQPLGAWAGEPILHCPPRSTNLEVILARLDALRRRDLLALKMQG